MTYGLTDGDVSFHYTLGRRDFIKTRHFAPRPVWGLIALRALFPVHSFFLVLPVTVPTAEVTVSLPVCYSSSYKPNSITLACSELAPNRFGASSKLASVMEFGFYIVNWHATQYLLLKRTSLGGLKLTESQRVMTQSHPVLIRRCTENGLGEFG